MPLGPPASRLRVGLLGGGRIARGVHLPVLTRLPGVELAGVAETDPELRDACSSAHSAIPVFADYRELLDRGALDAAVICLPTALHGEAAVTCFERGLHVYLEKPLAATLAEGERVMTAWRSARTVGAIGFNLRFHALASRLRQAVRDGVLGEVMGGQMVFSAAARRSLPEWKRHRSSGGGALLDLVSHQVDLARFVFDSEIVEVSALLRSVVSEDDSASVELRLASGPLVTILASLAAVEEDRVAVYGSRGGLVLDRYRSSTLAFVPAIRERGPRERLRAARRAFAAMPRQALDAVRPPREKSFAAALGAFASASRGAEWQGADLDDGWRSLVVVAAAENAAANGRTVALAGERA